MHKQNGIIITALMIALGTSSAAQAKIIKNNSPKNPLLKKADVKLIGPGGDTVMFYPEDGNIVVQYCKGNYEPVSNKSDCEGVKNSIPMDEFKRILKERLKITKADRLAPLTPDDVKKNKIENAELHDILAQRKVALQNKIDAIQSFIDQGGGKVAEKDKKQALLQLNLLEQSITNMAAYKKAVNNVNAQIDLIVSKIVSTDPIPTVVADGKDSNNAIYNLLKKMDPNDRECGTDEILEKVRLRKNNDEDDAQTEDHERATWIKNIFISEAFAKGISHNDNKSSKGKILERIQNCAPMLNSTKVARNGTVWNLVARKKVKYQNVEVWRDSKTGKIWSDAIVNKEEGFPMPLRSTSVLHATETDLKDLGKCQSEEAALSQAGIKEIKFRLPKMEDFEEASINGMDKVTRDAKTYFTAPKGEYMSYSIPQWDSSIGTETHTFLLFEDANAYVRCVGEE